MKPLIILLFFFCVYVVSCNNNPVNNSQTGPTVDPTILQTDTLGRILGGDTTDWCMGSGWGSYSLDPAYPNPAHRDFKVEFGLPQAQNVKLFFKDSAGVEVILFENNLNAGTYMYQIIVEDYMIQKKILKLCISAGGFNCSGDVQFY
jgi:hypothetical protein